MEQKRKGPQTPEGKQRCADAQRGRIKSPDEKQKLSNFKKQWWANVKNKINSAKENSIEPERLSLLKIFDEVWLEKSEPKNNMKAQTIQNLENVITNNWMTQDELNSYYLLKDDRNYYERRKLILEDIIKQYQTTKISKDTIVDYIEKFTFYGIDD